MKKKQNMIIYAATMVLAFVLLYWIGQTKQRRIATIKSTGVETTGTIIDKGKTLSGSGGSFYSVHFEFEHKGKRIVAYQSLYDRAEYDYAIIGKRYKVKYLSKNPKNGNAIIFIGEPR